MTMLRRGVAALILVPAMGLVSLTAGCKKDQYQGAQAEVRPASETVKLDLPAVPDFSVPKNDDGTRTVKELRVKGRKLLDTQVTVKGYVTWVYDCATAIAQPGQTPKEVATIIEQDPTKCRRPTFYIGDTIDTPIERSLWIVEVTDPPTKLEKERLPKEEIKAWLPVPPYKVGDEVVVTGMFKVRAGGGDANSQGLVVYQKLENKTQQWAPPADAPLANAEAGATGGREPPPGVN